jgi:protein FAM50
VESDAPVEAAPVKKPKFTKNPEVDTSFLPDRDRESRERLEREQLRKEWLEKQEKIKSEGIEITYSYWDGSGHRKSVEVGFGFRFGLRLRRERAVGREWGTLILHVVSVAFAV